MNTLPEVIRPVQAFVFGATHPGARRVENQDSFLAADLSAAEAQNGYRIDSKELAGTEDVGQITIGSQGLFLMVADGMGGAAAGGVASELAATYTYEDLLRRWIPERDRSPQRLAITLRSAVEAANTRVHGQAQQHAQLHGMGTTLTAAVVLGDVLYIAQVGDSRAYLLRGESAVQLTRDQSMVEQMIASGLLSPEEAEQSKHRHVILQALGISDHVQVDLTYQPLRRGDVAILCSDGLSGLVRPEEMAAVINAAEDLAAACGDLIALANERGGPDNITVVVARFGGPGLEDPRPEDPAGYRVLQLPSEPAG